MNRQMQGPTGKNLKKTSVRVRLFIIGITLVGLILACNSPNEGQPESADRDAVGTAVQQTLIAGTVSAEQTRVAALQNPPEDQQPPDQQELPTATFTPEISETPSQTPSPTLTWTPEVPVVQVSENTNCRIGPGKVYELIGALLVGEQTEIVAKDPSETYWYVRNPDQGGYCWLWGYYATTSGNTASLPVFTPPPTPTFTPSPTPEPSFVVNYHHFDQCGLVWHIVFSITNNGGLIFQSVTTTTTDTDTGETVNYTKDAFDEWDTCILQSTANDLTPGESGFTTSESLSNNPAGHTIDATIKLCSENGLGGTCVTKNISFVP